ncbi:MAG: hypothetical protein N2510_01910 [Ignavibacteria bacterium]|nr:hypothetical protein [Ignavibacteria bacterium]
MTPWAVLWIINSATGKSVKKIFRKLEDKYSFKTDYSKKVGFKNLPSAWGIYRNRNVKIESILADTPDGKKVLPHTQLTVDCPDSNGFNFLIAKRTRKNNAAFISGSSLTDDNEFDNKFIVQTSDLAKFRKVLDFNSKFKFEQAYSLGFDGLLKLENNTFRYIEKGLLRDEHDLLRLELILHEICDIADSLKYS